MVENDSHKIIREFLVQIDDVIEAQRSDLIVTKKKDNRKCQIIDLLFHLIQEQTSKKLKRLKKISASGQGIEEAIEEKIGIETKLVGLQKTAIIYCEGSLGSSGIVSSLVDTLPQ